VNTLVHEESHFNAVGGTQDYVYGKPRCLALAQSNPIQASHNAGACLPPAFSLFMSRCDVFLHCAMG
jgi:hypothetical protein